MYRSKLFLFCLLTIVATKLSSGTLCSCFQKPVQVCDSTIPLLKIHYPLKTISICDENDINERSVFQPTPEVTFAEADQNTFYTLIMEDPDAPNHLEGEAWLHWIVANISGSSLVNGDISEGIVVTTYRPPNPPKGSGVHRYLTYVFSEPLGGTEAAPLNTITDRKKFKIQDYACERGLCGPLASNMFKSKHASE